MRQKTVEKIKQIINETVSRKYWGNRVAMPYFKSEHGYVSWEDLAGSPADSNSFTSYMALNYYNKEHLDPIHADFEARLDEIDDTLYPHVEDTTIHVTSTDKTNWNANVTVTNNHVSDSTIHVTSTDKTNWNGKSVVTVSEEEVSGAPTIKSMTNNGTSYNFPSGGGTQPHLYASTISFYIYSTGTITRYHISLTLHYSKIIDSVEVLKEALTGDSFEPSYRWKILGIVRVHLDDTDENLILTELLYYPNVFIEIGVLKNDFTTVNIECNLSTLSNFILSSYKQIF